MCPPNVAKRRCFSLFSVVKYTETHVTFLILTFTRCYAGFGLAYEYLKSETPGACFFRRFFLDHFWTIFRAGRGKSFTSSKKSWRLQPGQSERYLGIQIGHDILKIPQWDTIIRNINDIFKYWNQLGLAIFGRTLLINSSQMSKLWFVGALATASTSEEIAMAKAINSYFRKGKRNNTVSHATRVLPKEFGGLGQLEISAQLKLLKIKWIIRAHSGSDSLWIAYWHECENQIKTHFNLVSDLRLASLNWPKVKATASNKLFPFVVDAFKAWHHFKLYTNTNDFYEVSCQPLLDNKYVVCPVSGKSFLSYPDFNHVTDRTHSLTVGLFFKVNIELRVSHDYHDM